MAQDETGSQRGSEPKADISDDPTIDEETADDVPDLEGPAPKLERITTFKIWAGPLVGVFFLASAACMGWYIFCSAIDSAFSDGDVFPKEQCCCRDHASSPPVFPASKYDSRDDNFVMLSGLDVLRRMARATLAYLVFWMFMSVGKRALMPDYKWNRSDDRSELKGITKNYQKMIPKNVEE